MTKEKIIVNPCSKCGERPAFENSFGGPEVYVALYCKCGNNSKKRVNAGVFEGCYLPQHSHEEAAAEWNKLNPVNRQNHDTKNDLAQHKKKERINKKLFEMNCGVVCIAFCSSGD